MGRIGFLHAVQNENVTAFAQALRDLGYVEGQNVLIETRIYGRMLDQLPKLANELVTLKCDVLLIRSAPLTPDRPQYGRPRVTSASTLWSRWS